MSVDGLSSGIDNKITWTDATGILNYEFAEQFQAKEDANVIKQVAMDGQTRHPKFHQGWSGSFILQRNGNFMDYYIARQEAAYFAGVDQLPITITQTITEPNGTISQYQFTNVVIVLEDAGSWTGTDIVKQHATFMASRKKPIQ